MSSHALGYVCRAGEWLWSYSMGTADTRIFEKDTFKVHFNEPIDCVFDDALADFPV